MGKTKIEWAEKTWNPVTGCTRISEGCKNCYAERMAKRLRGKFGYPTDDPFRVTLHYSRFTEPMKWKKSCLVFVCSMGDLFHPNIPFMFIDYIMSTIYKTDRHQFLILTKRPERMKEYINYKYFSIPNLWLGVSVENQETADWRIPILLQIPAAVRFISCEPLLSPINITKENKDIDWVICGGESGPNARPMHPDWARSLRDQCQESGVPFFFKQWGNYRPFEPTAQQPFYRDVADLNQKEYDAHGLNFIDPVTSGPGKWNGYKWYDDPFSNIQYLKTGKKIAGRILDGKKWNEFPKVKNA